MTEPNEWDAAASVYEEQFEKTTGYTVDRLVDWVGPSPSMHVADVAAGPGVVTCAMASAGARVSASDFSPAMVARLLARAKEEGLADLVDAEVADAAALPLDDDSVDGAVSNFGVIFCPDIEGALRELARVTRPGGRMAMTAWTTEAANGWTTLLAADYADKLGFTLGERPMYRWSRADDLRNALTAGDWHDVAVDEIEFPPTVHPSADHVGEALETPATRLALSVLTPSQREQLRDYLVSRARALFGDGAVPLPRQAWLARGHA